MRLSAVYDFRTPDHMTASLSTIAAWSYGIAAAGFAALALQLSFGLRREPQRLPLLIPVVLSAIWGLLGWAFAVKQTPALLLSAAIADVARMAGWFSFLLMLIVGPWWAGRLLRGRGLLVAGIVLTIVGFLAQGLIALDVPGVGDAARLAIFNSLGMAVFALVLVEALFRNLPGDARWSLKPICIGLVAAFGFDIYLYTDALLFTRFNADAFSVRGFAHALVIPLVAIAATRGGDWTSRVTLSRGVVLHSAALAASGVYLLLVAAAGYYVRYFGGEWGGAFQIALLFAGVLLLGLLIQSGSMRAKLKVLVNKHFFRYRYDYREEWLRFTQTLSACSEQPALGYQIIYGLARLVESPSGALWVKDRARCGFVQSARWNMNASDSCEPVTSSFAVFLAESRWVVDLEELRSAPGRYGGLDLPAWVGEVPQAWLIVPLINRNEVIGFVILGTARTPIEINWEVNDLLKTAGSQAASFLAQVEATEALLETRKFEAFNRMSAFVVHDLKNIMSQLSLMTKNAVRHKDNPEFQHDMLVTVTHAVERMKQLMMQLREGATPIDAARGVDLAEIVRRIHRTKTGHQPAPELELVENVFAKGHEDRIERVIGHIVQNAIDATAHDGRVWIRLERQGEQAVIEVGDTGHGMTPEFIRDRLFKPFQTTKSAGMGIGAYESYQYVHELGGRISVESALNIGTRMRVVLPIYDGGQPRAELESDRAVA